MDEDVFIGEIRLFSGRFVPDGWLPCDGGWHPVSTFAALHATIGYTFGGNEHLKQFAVPDLRGRAALGSGSGNYTFGNHGGEERASAGLREMPAHSHTMRRKSPQSSASKGPVPSPSSNLGVLAEASTNAPYMMMAAGYAVDSDLHPDTIGVAGMFAAPHENRQPFLALQFMIAYRGDYPAIGGAEQE